MRRTNSIEVWVGDEHKRLLEFSDRLDRPILTGWKRVTSRFPARRTNEGVWALPFSPSSGEATGEAFLVTPDGGGASISDDGTMAHVTTSNSGRYADWSVDLRPRGEIGSTIGQSQEGIFESEALSLTASKRPRQR